MMDMNSTTRPGRAGGGRIGYLDALRGFAILLVIEGHVRLFGMSINSYDTLSALMLYSFDLPLFFLISGFLGYKTNISRKEIITNVLKKFRCLVIPAVFFSIVYNLLYHKSILTSFEMGFGIYWFTITLFECFLLYYVVLFLLPYKARRTYILLILGLISILCIFLLSANSSYGPNVLDTNHLFKYFYFFVLGMLAKNYQKYFRMAISSEIIKAFCIIAFFTLLVLIEYPIWPSSVFHLLRDIILRLLGVTIIVILFVEHASIFEHSGKVVRTLVYIGKKSLPIYLLQYFFMPNLKGLELTDKLDQFSIHMISSFYTVLITFVCCCFICMIEQSQFVRKYIIGHK